MTITKRRAVVRLAAALAIAAGAVGLAGCADDLGAPPVQAVADCYPPLACGPFYPVPYYPYYAHPYLGYLHDPAHTVIVTTGGRTSVTYRPYSPPLRPAFRAPVPQYRPAAPAARPAPAGGTQPRTAPRTVTRSSRK